MIKDESNSGFTIVELLVVIVIIGVLSAITLVTYSKILAKAVEATIASDLNADKKQLELFSITNGKYPETIDCAKPDSIDNKCLKSSNGNTLEYQAVNTTSPGTYFLASGNNTSRYYITENSSPTMVNGLICPSGFITVPGSPTFATSDFCVMKYEARQVGATNEPISTGTGLPWVNIDQVDSISNSRNVTGCIGCHLITEREWLTIAQNVLNVPSNWSGGSVGNGYIYSGHNDNNPPNPISDSSNGSDGYNSTLNVSPSNQKRSLTLSNGQVIWDMAGNVYEWTSGRTQEHEEYQPGVNWLGYAWREFTAVTNPGTVTPGLLPSVTGISGANLWDSSKGIGKIASSTGSQVINGFERSGAYDSTNKAGILMAFLEDLPSETGDDMGFRVAR